MANHSKEYGMAQNNHLSSDLQVMVADCQANTAPLGQSCTANMMIVNSIYFWKRLITVQSRLFNC